MKKLLFIFLFSIFLINMVNAQTDICDSSCASCLGIFALNQNIQLTQSCDNCTFVNISSITYPNSTIIYINQQMTKTNYDYNYSFNVTQLGSYKYFVVGDKDGSNQGETICFSVTTTGENLEITDSLLYIVLLIFVVIVFGVFIYGAFKIQWQHQRDSENIILAVNWKKLGKITCWLFSYLLLMWIFGILAAISRSYVSMITFEKYFEMFYLFMLYLSYPIMIVAVIMLFVTWFQNLKLEKKIKRGFEMT